MTDFFESDFLLVLEPDLTFFVVVLVLEPDLVY